MMKLWTARRWPAISPPTEQAARLGCFRPPLKLCTIKPWRAPTSRLPRVQKLAGPVARGPLFDVLSMTWAEWAWLRIRMEPYFPWSWGAHRSNSFGWRLVVNTTPGARFVEAEFAIR